MKHYFVESKGLCQCSLCKVFVRVLHFHVDKCDDNNCKVCQRVKKQATKTAPVPPAPAQASPLINHQTPSLDEEDAVVWQVCYSVLYSKQHFKYTSRTNQFVCEILQLTIIVESG